MPTLAIDLRSDTVTQPTAMMREAIAAAELGDDVYGEDPSINALEDAAAERLGKERALYVPSGTMANLVSLLTHCEAGDQVILGDQAHILRVEGGSFSRVAGLLPATLPNEADGGMDPELVRRTVKAAHPASPTPVLLALENTQNFCGGRCSRRGGRTNWRTWPMSWAWPRTWMAPASSMRRSRRESPRPSWPGRWTR